MTGQATTRTGATVRRRWRLLGSVATWALIALAAFFMWPANLGGGTSYVLVSGESMTPGYQPGDLLIARSGAVDLGDVIVYAPEGYGGAQVVHRVIGGDAEGWQVRGDANDFTDPFTPAGSEVRGVVVLHVAGFGAVARFLLDPFLWVGLILLGVGLLVWPSRSGDAQPAPEAIAS